LVTVSSYRSATSYKNVLRARTLQLFTDRPNNHSRSLGSLELIIFIHLQKAQREEHISSPRV